MHAHFDFMLHKYHITGYASVGILASSPSTAGRSLLSKYPVEQQLFRLLYRTIVTYPVTGLAIARATMYHTHMGANLYIYICALPCTPCHTPASTYLASGLIPALNHYTH